MPWVPGLNVRILTHERARVGRQSIVDALVALAAMMQAQQSDLAIVLGGDDVPVGVLTRQAALRALVVG